MTTTTYIVCGNTENHAGHQIEITATVFCSGRSRCGMAYHPPHDTQEQQTVWCQGVCSCGLRGFAHGPGEHK